MSAPGSPSSSAATTSTIQTTSSRLRNLAPAQIPVGGGGSPEAGHLLATIPRGADSQRIPIAAEQATDHWIAKPRHPFQRQQLPTPEVGQVPFG